MDEIEKTLQDCEKEKQAVLDCCSDIVIFFNKELRVISANSRMNTICSEPVGKHCRDLFCGQIARCHDCAVNNCFTIPGAKEEQRRNIVARKDGDDLYFRMTSTPVKNQKGEVEKIVVIAQDVTEKLRLEKQLKQVSKMEAIGTLAGGIAHDFNNILTPIMGYAEIMRLNFVQGKVERDESISYIDQILQSSNRAKKLVKQILAFSRSSDVQESAQQIHPVIKEGVKLINATLPSTLQIVQEIDEECGLVTVDPVEIHQLLINLCANAVDALAGKNGIIRIVLRQVDDQQYQKKWLELSVSDNGCGIPAELHERIFDPYFTTKEKMHGTGMGLSIVHGIIKRQGGKIRLDSILGKGTTITLSFPVVEENNNVEKVTDFAEYMGDNQHILLVDDEDQVAKAAADMLRRLNYRVTEMTSARESLLALHENLEEYDLVMTDLTMPYMTGIELCEKIKEIAPNLPVILFSGVIEEFSRVKAIRAGVDGFCHKPVSMSEMGKAVYQLSV